MLILQNIAYVHPDKDTLFHSINLTVNTSDKIALIGNNGSGKSTLLKIMAGILPPASGAIVMSSAPYYIPQLAGTDSRKTVGEALRIADKLYALREILNGKVSEQNLSQLDDDWGIEERCHEAMSYWKLDHTDLFQPLSELSGGQRTKVFLAGMMIHRPEIVLLDEPSNHLDASGRELLYQYISDTRQTLIIVSHDRTLLDLVNKVCELENQGITIYGGNYQFYSAQKEIAERAFTEELHSIEKALRKAKAVEREALQRQQKLDARGKRKQEKAGLPTISMNTLRNNAEKSTSKMKDVHAEKTEALSRGLNEKRKALPEADKMKMNFDESALHRGRILIAAKAINYAYGSSRVWKAPVFFQVNSGDRVAIKGDNGSGKTTLVRIILGELTPAEGILFRADFQAVYVDQDYSLINNNSTVYELAQQFNTGILQEHEVKSKLTHFLFTARDWHKPCRSLSGGEKMRLILCCLTIQNKAPDMIVLDEPTNNLDIQNIEILTAAIQAYKGTLIVISHDTRFLEQVGVSGCIPL